MSDTTNCIPNIALRVPGDWSNPRELLTRLPKEYRLGPESLYLPDGKQIEFIPLPPDEQFPQIFRSSCRRSATDGELATLDRYRLAVGLIGPGGSIESARSMMQAGAAIVRAGGAGAFIDNSCAAHGGSDWIEMTENGGPSAISYAYVSILRGSQGVYTMGMHVLGYSDLLMDATNSGEYGDAFLDLIRYLCGGQIPIQVGHSFADEGGPLFQIASRGNDTFAVDSPYHNPFGRLKIVSTRQIVERN